MEVTQSDSTTGAMQPGMFDPQATFSWSGLSYEAWGLSSTFSAVALGPLSLASRRMGALGSLGVAMSGNWTLPIVGTSLSLSTSVLGNGFSAALADLYVKDEGNALTQRDGSALTPKSCLRRTPAEAGVYVCGTLPTAGSSALTSSVSQPLFDGLLSFGVSATLLTFYTGYIGPADQFTNPNARPGIGAWHNTLGTIWIGSTPLSWLSIQAGTFSSQAAFTADGKWPRLPWWDFISPRSNLSTVYLSSTVTL